MKWVLLAGLVVLVVVVVFGIGRLRAAELKAGDEAPDFELQGSDGETYKLSDFRDKRTVVVAWCPKAFTSGCTAQCKSFRTEGDDLRAFDVAYFTASCDAAEKNKEFAKSLKLDFPILSDPSGKVARAYGVTDSVRKVPRRWTFFIDVDGKILHVDKEVKTKRHATDVAAKLAELGVAKKKQEE